MTARPDATTYFDGRTSRYDSHYDASTADGHALRARLAMVLRLLGCGPGSVLDAGMGPGRLCAELESRGWTVSGVDASATMVEAARVRVPSAADRLLRAEIEELPFEDESFDAVAATGVLEYVDVPKALAELTRVLRTGGVAVVSYPNPRALYGIWKSRVWYTGIRTLKRRSGRRQSWMPRGATEIPPERFAALLADAHLRVDATEHTSYLALPTPLDTLLPSLSWRLGRRLEGSGRRTARLLATQVVYAARKTG
ncbi:MAG: methyltransferase domain-containing protein [Actinobacteria bacterium]|nr:methyltransferase domain-containing protein [Actinomycetota bacterium]